MADDDESLFMCLLTKINIFAHFKIRKFVFLLLDPRLLSAMSCKYFLLSCRLSFYFLDNSLSCTVFNFDEVQFFYQLFSFMVQTFCVLARKSFLNPLLRF